MCVFMWNGWSWHHCLHNLSLHIFCSKEMADKISCVTSLLSFPVFTLYKYLTGGFRSSVPSNSWLCGKLASLDHALLSHWCLEQNTPTNTGAIFSMNTWTQEAKQEREKKAQPPPLLFSFLFFVFLTSTPSLLPPSVKANMFCIWITLLFTINRSNLSDSQVNAQCHSVCN